jgi:GNAT superfamily N-acetyltransferase
MEILQGEVTTAFPARFQAGPRAMLGRRTGRPDGLERCCSSTPATDVGQLRLLHVEPWARGLGIGRALVAECVAFARAAGYCRIRLWTHTVLESARRIYQAAGFEIVETAIHDEFGKPEQGETWELVLTS